MMTARGFTTVFAALALGGAAWGFTVDNRVPAGNLCVDRVEGDTVFVHQELRDTTSDWFYWAGRVTGAQGRTLTFRFTRSYAVGTRGPCVSLDRGRTWSFAAEAGATRHSFTYTVPADAEEVWLYETVPYLQTDWEAFLARHAAQRGTAFETGVLCRSRKGRAVEKARFGRLDGRAPRKFCLSARRHCSETMASFVLEGILEAVLADDETGAWYRAHAEVLVAPFMDKDGCEAGDQGKNRAPHDHNRDYAKFIYPETRALRDWAAAAGNRFDVLCDIHCPWLFGNCNEWVYQVHGPSAENNARVSRFGKILEKIQTGALAYREANDIRWGQGWNAPKNYANGRSLKEWATEDLDCGLVSSWEIPFATASGKTVTPDACREFGRDMARAFVLYLEGAAEAERDSISGVYPHLAMTNREGECGTGAVVPWADSLWVVTYAPHAPTGSSDKLYRIKPDLARVTRPESVGGTPADRLIHRESGQLLIGQYLVTSNGAVRAVPVWDLPGRLTGAARHLEDPARKVYVTDMEEALYELDVRTGRTRTLIRDGHNRAAFDAYFAKSGRTPPAGWRAAEDSTLFGYHGKGTCTGFGKLFYANNGQNSEAARRDPRTPAGCLAFWKPGMRNWELIRTNQFTEVTTRDGVYGNEHPGENPVWALGWDHRSVILSATADGETWHDYRLPKGSHSYDGAHGWNTEWPRIREIGDPRDFLATMHGTFWRFPADFAPGRAAGVRPRSTYLKVIADFAFWQGRVVFGCDDHAMSEFLNVRALKGKRAKARASESNLWFVEPGRLDALGPREGRGAVWAGDRVAAGQASDAYLFAGYERKWLWLDVPAEVQIDARGTGDWTPWRVLEPGGHSLDAAPAGEWVRLVARAAKADAYAVFHYGTASRTPSHTWAFTRAAPAGAGEIFKDDAPVPQGLITADAASLVYVDNGVRRRLPRRTAESPATRGRLCREVSTERDLLHAGDIFYELPADNAGGFRFVHPVTSTPRAVEDYDTWKGLLILKEGGALRAGVADDLWKLGKPVGVGGPWKDTRVEKDAPSDAYLMNGFDRKTLTLRADADTRVTLEADIDGMGTWMTAGVYDLKKDSERRIELPPSFAAYWARVRSSVPCTATAQFVYK